MSQRINPSYNAEINENLGKMTLVQHLPSLPPPSGLYQYNIYFNAGDSCFYHCTLIEGEWAWERVTYGIKRQYVLPVSWIVGDFTFNDLVNTFKEIILLMNTRYNDAFADMVEGDDGVNDITVIAKYNEIAKYVNRVCDEELPYATVGTMTEVELKTFVSDYVNKLITVLNPHAGASIEFGKFDAFIEKLASLNLTGSNAADELTKLINYAKTVKATTDSRRSTGA